MSTQCFTQELKEDGVRQALNRKYSAEVAARSGNR